MGYGTKARAALRKSLFGFAGGADCEAMQPDDSELLRRYAGGDSAAFRTLVERRFALVYAVALRQVAGDAHLARDVAQRVFLQLAGRAQQLSCRAVLSGWLYQAARCVAIDLVRAENRRKKRERDAMNMQGASEEPISDEQWQRLRPVLDEMIGELSESDRDAVVLRIVEDRPYAEVAQVLGLSPDAARMRVERALEKLRQTLRRRGVTSTRVALAGVLANQAVSAVPAGMVPAVAGAVLAGPLTATAGMTAAGWLMGFMAETKSAMTGAAVLAAVAIGVGVYHGREARALQSEVAAISLEVEKLNAALHARDGDGRIAVSRRVREATRVEEKRNREPSADTISAADVARMRETYEANRRLRASNPEYQRLLLESIGLSARMDHAAFYRAHQLTSERISAFEATLKDRTAAEMDRVDAAGALGIGAGDPAVKNLAARDEARFQERLQEILGDVAYADFRRREQLRPLHDMVQQVAADVCDTPAPLTAEQSASLTAIVVRNHPRLETPDVAWRSEAVDWSGVIREARAVLTPEQVKAWAGVVARVRWSDENIRRLNEEMPR